MPTLAEIRGEVIEKCIELESLMSEIITRHYFGSLYVRARPFVTEVLSEPHFDFALRTRVIENVFKRWIEGGTIAKLSVTESFLNKITNEPDNVRGIRNAFAHQEHPKRKESDHIQLHQDFLQLHESILSALNVVRQKYMQFIAPDLEKPSEEGN